MNAPVSTLVDLSKPSYRAAYAIARKLAAAGDRAGAEKLFAKLLLLVDAADGGLLGLSDQQILDRCALDPRLNYCAITEAMWAPIEWPVDGKVAA